MGAVVSFDGPCCAWCGRGFSKPVEDVWMVGGEMTCEKCHRASRLLERGPRWKTGTSGNAARARELLADLRAGLQNVADLAAELVDAVDRGN